MKQILKKIFYKLDSNNRNEILQRLDKIDSNLAQLQGINNIDVQVGDKLQLLEGTPYSTCAIPLDYPPSRNLRPRWGSYRPIIQELQDWFTKFDSEYLEMLNYMRSLKLNHIRVHASQKSQAAWVGGAVAPIDALALYAMILKNKPKHYVEIGSGMTTCFARQAVNDGKLDTKIISIDPQPRMEIESICDEIFRDGLELFDVSKLGFLEPGDILFFDGSHRTFMNSDVTVFFIDILPKLKPGVIIHLHDITLPYDYPDMFTNWYWSEQYMLAVCFLNGMEKINPLLPTTYICRNEKFKELFSVPFVELGDENNEGWVGGGSMWFSYK